MRERERKVLTPADSFPAFLLRPAAGRGIIAVPRTPPRSRGRPMDTPPPGTPSPQEVTRLLRAWGAGDEAALAALVPLVHAELKRQAKRYMRGEGPGHPLQTTALVNEAYLRLVGAREVQWQNRAHFFAVSARLIRQVLVDV